MIRAFWWCLKLKLQSLLPAASELQCITEIQPAALYAYHVEVVKFSLIFLVREGAQAVDVALQVGEHVQLQVAAAGRLRGVLAGGGLHAAHLRVPALPRQHVLELHASSQGRSGPFNALYRAVSLIPRSQCTCPEQSSFMGAIVLVMIAIGFAGCVHNA